MSSKDSLFIAVLAAGLWVGCASGADPVEDGASQTAQTSASSGSEQSSRQQVDQEQAGEADGDVAEAESAGELTAVSWAAPDSAATGVDSMLFSNEGVLWVGFEDAAVAKLEDGEWSSRKVLDEAQSIVTISPKGRVALVRSEPGQLVRVSDKKTILRLNDVDDIESATFNRDGTVFFVAETSGKLHIWRGGDQLYTLPDETVQKFVDRQLPDFTAHFDSIRGPVSTTKPIRVAVSNSKGELLWWDPRKPNAVEWVARMDSPARSMGIVGDHVVASSEGGQLGVASRAEQMRLRWSRDARAQWVATTPAWTERFVEIADGKLGVRSVDDGGYHWRVQLPEGDICGLEVSADASRMAICVDEVIAVFDSNTRELIGTLHRSDDALQDTGF